MTAIWAHCDDCERWYYCDDPGEHAHACPVCCRPPSRFLREDDMTDNVA